MTTAAVILAAGDSSRFSADDPGAAPGAKLLALVWGHPLITWAVAPAMDAGLDEVVVVIGASDLHDAALESVTRVHNPHWREGQASSLRAGLDWCAHRGHDHAVIGLGDMPGLTAEAWRRVAAAPEGDIVYATYDGRRGHPVRLAASVWPMLPATGDEGARVVARRHPELVREVACPGVPTDVDTPEDLERWT